MLTGNFTTSAQIEQWLEGHGVQNATHQLKYTEVQHCQELTVLQQTV